MNDMIDYVIEPDPIKRKQMQHSMKSTNAHRTNTFHKPEAYLSPFMIYCQVHLSQVQKQFDSMVYQEFQERQKKQNLQKNETIDANVQNGENGFGYDPIFNVEDRKCTAAELEPDVKQQISHRALALVQLKVRLQAALSCD